MRNALQGWVQGIATHDLEVMAVRIGLAHQRMTEIDELAVVLGSDAADDVAPHATSGVPLLLGKSNGGQGLLEIVRDAADGVMSVGEAVERKVEIDDEVGAAVKKLRDDGFHLGGQESVGGEIHMAHAVVRIEELDDFGEILAKERFAPGDPQLVKGRRGLADALEFVEAEIATLVQFVPIKAGATKRVAGRGDKQEDGLQSLGAEYAACVMKILEPHECSCAGAIVDDHLLWFSNSWDSRSELRLCRSRQRRQVQSLTMYSKQVLDHFEHPRFAGELAEATVCVDVDNPACGDKLRLALRIEAGRIVEVRFKAKGCVPSMACASRLAEMVNGMGLRDAQEITREQLVESLGGLPQASAHAAYLAVDALKKVLRATTESSSV